VDFFFGGMCRFPIKTPDTFLEGKKIFKFLVLVFFHGISERYIPLKPSSHMSDIF
jgi:hypothetical protein